MSRKVSYDECTRVKALYVFVENVIRFWNSVRASVAKLAGDFNRLAIFQYGDTPLHTSARYGHAGVTRILISALCRVSDQNKVSKNLKHLPRRCKFLFSRVA